MEGHSLAFEALSNHRIRGAEIHIDKYGSLGQVISRNPSCAPIPPRWSDSLPPDRIEINGLEEVGAFFVVQTNRGQELVSWLEHLVFHLQTDRFPDIDLISALTILGSDSDSQESGDFSPRRL